MDFKPLMSIFRAAAVAMWLMSTTATAVEFEKPTQTAPLPDVTVGAVNGRPTIHVGGQPIAMSGYSPMSWSKPHTEKAMPRFFPHQLGFYLISVPPISTFATSARRAPWKIILKPAQMIAIVTTAIEIVTRMVWTFVTVVLILSKPWAWTACDAMADKIAARGGAVRRSDARCLMPFPSVVHWD